MKMIQVAKPIVGEEEIEAIREVLLSGRYVSGRKVAEFERTFSEYIGTSNAVAVNSGTAALHVALAVLGIGPGDEVIVPPLTFMSTITAVLHQNAIPRFADIEKESFCISPESIEEQITSRTKAVIPVHLYGNAAEMDVIMEIAKRHNLYVVEDCAQAHGTEYKGRKVGSIGDMGSFSFFATKHMTTGEGGILTMNRREWAERGCLVRSHGLVNRDDHICLGYNYRMNEMAAAMGLVQLKKLDTYNAKRIENSKYLLERLQQEEREWFSVPLLENHIKHTFFWCPLRIRAENGFSTKEVIRRLKERGIEVRQRYYEPLYMQKVVQDLSPYPKGCPFTCQAPEDHQDYHNLHLPNAEAVAGNVIGLPNHPDLTKDDLTYVVKNVLSLY